MCIALQAPLVWLVTKKKSQQKKSAAERKKIKKTYSTRDSLVVPYQSTDRAQRCLTSQFGWDAVLSPWYDRMTRALEKSCTLTWKVDKTKISGEWSVRKKKKTFFFSNPERSNFFCFSRPVHSWPFIRRSHQEHHYQMLGVQYLNSIRKS